MNIIGYGKASIDSIINFEEMINFTLPEDYKKFLREFNGGSARENIFYVPKLEEIIPLDVFFGLNIDRRLDLRTWYNEYKRDMLPFSFIFAHDPGTGFIVLINGPDVKGVYFWDHSCAFPQSNKNSNTYWIADSFQDFINSLRDTEEI